MYGMEGPCPGCRSTRSAGCPAARALLGPRPRGVRSAGCPVSRLPLGLASRRPGRPVARLPRRPLGPAARFPFGQSPGLSSIARLTTRPRSPLEKAGRPALSAFRGFPRAAPVSGGESFSTPLRPGCTRGFPQHFQDFLSIHKSSTINPLLSPAISRCPPHSPQDGPQAGVREGRVTGGRPAQRRAGCRAAGSGSGGCRAAG
jgi:hypothetical protein